MTARAKEKEMHKTYSLSATLCGLLAVAGCGDGSTPAIREGIGAACAAIEDCADALNCLTNFAGGYCGLSDCTSNADCLEGAICVDHEGTNYCFLTCLDKIDCNENRPVESESNCSSNITRVDGGSEKACVPPSSG